MADDVLFARHNESLVLAWHSGMDNGGMAMA
jgi:hypothetical protein